MTASGFELLCLAASPSIDGTSARTVLGSEPDWNEIASLAAVHGLRPALIDLLSRFDWQHVPAAVRGELERFQSRHLLRTLEMAKELAQMVNDFRSHGITFAVFKGAALSVQLYRQLAAREYNDFDFIVPPDQVAKAEWLLAQRGYQPAFADPRFRRFFQGHLGQCAFKRKDTNTLLDLHWTFSGSFLPFPVRPDEIRRRLATVSIAGVDVHTLHPSDVALLLAGHGTKEAWRSLMWVRDFAHLVHRWPDLDWIEIHRRARGNGCGDAVLLACAAAEQVLATPVPTALAQAVSASARVQRRVGTLTDSLRQGGAVRRHLADLDLCDRRVDRLAALVGFALAPTLGDFAALPLPRMLWPAYYVTRPVRLLSKAMRGTLPFS